MFHGKVSAKPPRSLYQVDFHHRDQIKSVRRSSASMSHRPKTSPLESDHYAVPSSSLAFNASMWRKISDLPSYAQDEILQRPRPKPQLARHMQVPLPTLSTSSYGDNAVQLDFPADSNTVFWISSLPPVSSSVRKQQQHKGKPVPRPFYFKPIYDIYTRSYDESRTTRRSGTPLPPPIRR